MKFGLYGGVLLSAVMLCLSSSLPAAEKPTWGGMGDAAVERQLKSLNSAIDELVSPVHDTSADGRSRRGGRLNEAFVALTGEAVNPLFGVTALGVYNYYRTPEYLRESLPLYDRPVIWLPLLCIILLMLFNSTLCEAIPFLKIPLNALGDIVNKAGAIAVLPLVVKMFADSVAEPAGGYLSAAANVLFPVAHAGDGVLSTMWYCLGWMGGALAGIAVYGAVWLTFNMIDVLILICPFPGIDALLKSFRLAVIGALTGLNQVSPFLATILAAVIVVISLFLAGWSFRLSVFGLIFSTDILFLRKGDPKGERIGGFSCSGLTGRGVPMRSWGRLEMDAGGELVFAYRPWLIMGLRVARLGAPESFAAGRGLLNPFVVEKEHPESPWLRFPPRFRGCEKQLAERYGLNGVVDCGVSGALRSWFAEVFGENGGTVQKHADNMQA